MHLWHQIMSISSMLYVVLLPKQILWPAGSVVIDRRSLFLVKYVVAARWLLVLSATGTENSPLTRSMMCWYSSSRIAEAFLFPPALMVISPLNNLQFICTY